MTTSTSSRRYKARRHSRGFALIVTLSLMILLTVIAVGLLSLSSITLRTSAQGEAMQIARANARLAMMLALGDLQKSLGPDARMSARAETLGKDSRVKATVAANTPQAWWLGASHTDGVTPIGANNEPVTWLVSGLPGGKFGTPTNPVDMVKGGSLDLAQFTGGAPIQAGRMSVANAAGKVTGSYAYYVDDDGMKAQLAASHPDVRNDNPLNLAGGVLPGTHPITQLRNLTGSGTGDVALVQKLGSTKDLELIGVPKNIAREKFFAYTTHSKGILSDSRAGGLRKDLTAAFEMKDSSGKYTVFDKVFPSNAPGKFIAITPEKLAQASELSSNGYINWSIFRDYYNLKLRIKELNGIQCLQPIAFSNKDFINQKGGGIDDAAYTPFYSGSLGPHQMKGPAGSPHVSMPYGNYPIQVSVVAGLNAQQQPVNYRNNPVFPILLEMWQKSWLSTTVKNNNQNDPVPAQDLLPNQLQTNVQLFTSHYNPYNVGIYMKGDDEKRGPRVLKYPQVIIDVKDGGTSIFGKLDSKGAMIELTRDDLQALPNKLQSHVPLPVVLEPGHSHVIGFGQNVSKSNSVDGKGYTDKVTDIVNKSAYDTRLIKAPMDGRKYSVTTEYAMREPAFAQGQDSSSGNDSANGTTDPELCQVFFSLLANDAIEPFDGTKSKRPGKIFTKSLSRGEMTPNTANVVQFSLRTTTEPTGGVRPLVDANIRAQWNNPKWDSKLGLPALAAYTLKFSDDNNDPAPKQLAVKPDTLAGGTRGFSYWGNYRQADVGNDRVILFDVPRRDLLSLGQLQHAAAGRFSYEPTYIVGNSYANPRISLPNWQESTSDTYSSTGRGNDQWKIASSFNLYDASYLVNELIWDSYTFTTIPQVADNVGGGDVTTNDLPALLERTKHLPNPRYVPYEPEGSKFTAANLQMVGSDTTGSFFHNAGHLLVDGSFNVNSTSVDAWEAFLTGTLDLPVRQLDSSGVVTGFQNTKGVRYPRTAAPLGKGMKSGSLNENYWTGFRELTDGEVKKLATQIVAEIKDRGPFLTLGAFVNRKLENGKNGKSGALQAALDNTVNTNLDSNFQSPANASVAGNQGSGFPGQLLQGDVLQALGPYMTVHSDTFTIRAYGEAKSGTTITAKAYCEAVVQRLPDPVRSGTSPGSPQAELALPTSPFGRQFSIVSFRWLHEAEI